MILVMIVGAIVIISIFAFLAFVIIKAWHRLLKLNEKDNIKAIKSTKKEGIKFLYTLLSPDYDTERYNVIAAVSVISIALCALVLWSWFSACITYI